MDVAGNILGSAVTITANAALSNLGGRIDLGTGVPESSWTGAQVTGQTGNVSITATNGAGVINAGAISAAGDVNITNNTGQGHVHIGDYLSGIITGATVTAGNNITIAASGTDAAIDAGLFNAGGLLDLTAISTLNSNGGRIVFDGGSVGSASFLANAQVTSGISRVDLNGNLVVNTGNLFVDGNANNGARMSIDGNITVAGTMSFGANLNSLVFGAGPYTISAGSVNLTARPGTNGVNANWNVVNNLTYTGGEAFFGNIVAGGLVDINAVGGSASFPHIIGDISAGSINVQFTGSDVSNTVPANIGNLTANGASGNITVGVNFVGGTFSNGTLRYCQRSRTERQCRYLCSFWRNGQPEWFDYRNRIH